ncbi:YARHG domain-containing protein [Rhodopseudomonas sp. NSM]|uniref:YARHG domain-containing protein n=1 Tax=Rhodopseudomonas sp. NSM TaxID=3457630 RepID=UPI004036A8FB
MASIGTVSCRAGLAGWPRLIAGACLLIAGAGITASSASAQSCQALWVERNSYYKDAGYCFKTRRAIGYFGNRGCSYDDVGDVPLSANVRERIAEIKALERRFGCD